MYSAELYQSELYDLLEQAERSDTEHRAGYPAYEKEERMFRLLCKAIEAGSKNTMGTCISMYLVKEYLYIHAQNARKSGGIKPDGAK